MHFLRVRALVREGPLGDDFATVQLVVHPVDGDAIDLNSEGHGLLHRMSAPEGRKQRRVYIDNLAPIRAQQGLPHYPHITGKAYQIHFRGIQKCHYLLFVVGLGGVGVRVEDKALHAQFRSALYHGGAGLVAYHYGHVGIDTAFGTSLGYGHEIGSGSAGKYG